MSDNAQSKLNQILGILGLSKETAEPKVEFASEALENGTMIEAEVFEPGASVFIVTDGERVPLPVADYPLQNGKVLVVAEEGVISEIKEASAEAPAEEEMAEEEDQKEEVEFASKEEVESLKSQIEELKSAIAEMKKPKEEMSSQEAPADEAIFNPEDEEKKKFELSNVGPKSRNSVQERIFKYINNK